eukprot:GHVS01085344.1.p1 GENE.GHVS01085344.1~~GHVS01085344.1.p1  ORF type:complete len:261 (-),score=22.30 GHVS01085344.1:206-988(-)
MTSAAGGTVPIEASQGVDCFGNVCSSPWSSGGVGQSPAGKACSEIGYIQQARDLDVLCIDPRTNSVTDYLCLFKTAHCTEAGIRYRRGCLAECSSKTEGKCRLSAALESFEPVYEPFHVSSEQGLAVEREAISTLNAGPKKKPSLSLGESLFEYTTIVGTKSASRRRIISQIGIQKFQFDVCPINERSVGQRYPNCDPSVFVLQIARAKATALRNQVKAKETAEIDGDLQHRTPQFGPTEACLLPSRRCVIVTCRFDLAL